jgi:hypothetical protein
MEIPVRVVMRGMKLSSSTASMIAGEAQSMSLFFSRVLYCEVHIDGPGRHHRRGSYEVRMILGIPGRDIIISRQKRETLHEAVTDAFRAAGRRLEDHARRVRGDVKRRSTEALS